MSFENDTPYGVLVDTTFSSPNRRHGPVRIWSTGHRVETSVSDRSNVTSTETIYDTSPECEPQQGWEGFSITSYRKVWTPDGKLVKDEAYPWTYKPTPPSFAALTRRSGSRNRAADAVCLKIAEGGGGSGTGDAR